MSDIDVGSIIADRYEITKLLGKGGMGMVYRAKDWQRKEDVALKTLLPKYAANAQAVRRFKREVEVARQLDHPCIVKIYDAQRLDDLLFYTMEYLDGKSLRTLIQGRQKHNKHMGIGSTVRILSLLCHALEHAHDYTIHRDVSPENVMVQPNGDVKLLDFGLAKLETFDPDLTRVGISLGKVQYGAPEQRIDAKTVDHRADIYSLGIMFFEMLTSELPMGSEKITAFSKELPASCDALYLKATARKPADRYQDAREFRKALERIYQQISGKSIEVMHDTPKTVTFSEIEMVEEALPKLTVLDNNHPFRVRVWRNFLNKLRSWRGR